MEHQRKLSQRVLLSLGSNSGDPLALLSAAVRAVAAIDGVRAEAISPVYLSEPMGDAATADFYNAAMTIYTDRAPIDILHELQAIETSLGPVRTVRWGDRTIDIDIVLFGSVTLATEELVLPHPGFRSRLFVLLPALDIDPSFTDIDGTPFADMAAALHGRCEKMPDVSLMA